MMTSNPDDCRKHLVAINKLGTMTTALELWRASGLRGRYSVALHLRNELEQVYTRFREGRWYYRARRLVVFRVILFRINCFSWIWRRRLQLFLEAAFLMTGWFQKRFGWLVLILKGD